MGGEASEGQGDAGYRVLFEASPLPMLIVDEASSHFLAVNDAACRLYGWSRSEMLRLSAGAVRVGDTGLLQWHRRKDGSTFEAEVASQRVEFLRRTCRLDVVNDVTERERLARVLRESEERYRLLFDSGPMPKFLYDLETLQFVAVNQLAIDHYGWTRDEILTMRVEDLGAADEPQISATSSSAVHRHRRKDGTLIDVELASHALTFDGRAVMLVAVNDVTARQRLREQFLHAQKMEAVGRLAGGVAHDFNNLLAVILVVAEWVARELGEQHHLFADVEDIRTAASRAGALTRQLLAVSRQQVLSLRVLALGEVLADVEKMLRRLIGEDIHIEVDLGDQPLLVRADIAQLEHVLLNLAVNARDAMPSGGSLRLAMCRAVLDGAHAASLELAPGPYAALIVIDDGQGMDSATRARIFEPFFTTKAKGKGSGLGLSTVFGIVKQLGGAIDVVTAPEQGTRFTIYLPVTTDPPEVRATIRARPLPLASPGETVLLVEDDAQVRAAVRRVLSARGYQVLEAPSGQTALRIVDEHVGRLDLLLTDLVMPDVDGRTMATLVRERHPRLKVLLMSGYSEHPALEERPIEPGLTFLAKPFSAEVLSIAVRRALDSAI